jgi:putative hydrolase of HD superfamily
MLIVAIFSYIFSMELGVSDARIYNNFFSALFHDLPEILTKDIVRPIKSSIEGLEDIIKLYEKKQVDERILPLLPESWRQEMTYFIQDEFEDKIIENGRIKIVDDASKYDDPSFRASDGKLNETCDKLGAYIEASMALEYGIKSETLIESKRSLYEKYSSRKKQTLSFKPIFDYFN